MSVESLKTTFESEPGYLKACELLSLLEQGGHEAYIVGGAVRDALLGRKLHDFDLCTDASPEDMKKVFTGFKLLTHGEEFGTLTVVTNNCAFEVTSYRGEGTYSDKRRPDSVEFLKSLEEDLKRRDFTINALAFHPLKGLIDAVEGLRDIKRRVLRTVGDPNQRFSEDALRIARLYRFSLSLGFDIEEKTLWASRDKFSSLSMISKERTFNEIEKALSGMPALGYLNNWLGEKFEVSFLKNKELNLFDKAYLVLQVSNRLTIDYKDYILNKKLRGASSWLFSMTEYSGMELESLFIKCVEHYEYYGEEQERLWKVVCILNKKAGEHVTVFKPYKKNELKEDLDSLKKEYKGVELGQQILELKRKKMFG